MILTFSPSELSVKSGHTNTIVVKADTRADTWSALSIPSWATVKENRDNSCTITLSPPVGTKADTYQMRIWAEDSLSDDRAVGVMKVRAGDLDDEPITPDQLDAAAKAIKSYVDKVFAARANLRLTRPHIITPEGVVHFIMNAKYIKDGAKQRLGFTISDNNDDDVYPVILSAPDWVWLGDNCIYMQPPKNATTCRWSNNGKNPHGGLEDSTMHSVILGLNNNSHSCTIKIAIFPSPAYLVTSRSSSGWGSNTTTYDTTSAGTYAYRYLYNRIQSGASGPVSPAILIFPYNGTYFNLLHFGGEYTDFRAYDSWSYLNQHDLL